MSQNIGLVLMVLAGVYIVFTIARALDIHEARIEQLEKLAREDGRIP